MASGVFTKFPYGFPVSTPAQPRLGVEAGALRRVFEKLAVWHDRDISRRQLEMMDERALRDIGITRAQAEAEAARPFWRG